MEIKPKPKHRHEEEEGDEGGRDGKRMDRGQRPTKRDEMSLTEDNTEIAMDIANDDDDSLTGDARVGQEHSLQDQVASFELLTELSEK